MLVETIRTLGGNVALAFDTKYRMSSSSMMSIEVTMSAILATAFCILVGLHLIQIRSAASESSSSSSSSAAFLKWIPMQLPNPNTTPSKYCYEIFAWYYTVIWIGLFGFVVVSKMYESFTAWGYLGVCGGLALPLLLQPILYPQAVAMFVPSSIMNDNIIMIVNPDIYRPFHQRYSTKVNLYLLTYSFIGNYWYTHYFYSVLHARYTMPSHRFNNVPIIMYLATHFYFCTYHVCLSNGILRYVDVNYSNGWKKSLLFWYTIFFLAYFTAFMETLTISSFPYYTFQDRTMAYIWGSAFYGIYFIISFPGFYYLDDHVDDDGIINDMVQKTQVQHVGSPARWKRSDSQSSKNSKTLMDIFVTACGHGMIILILLDFVRLYLGIPLMIDGVAFAVTDN